MMVTVQGAGTPMCNALLALPYLYHYAPEFQMLQIAEQSEERWISEQLLSLFKEKGIFNIEL